METDSNCFTTVVYHEFLNLFAHTTRYELISSMEMELLWIYYRGQFSRLPFWSPYIIICIKIMKFLSKTLFAFRIEPESCGSCQRQINKCGKYNCEKYESSTNVNSMNQSLNCIWIKWRFKLVSTRWRSQPTFLSF